jgi:tetratricopeptide (TPR) repeat protein
MLRVRPRAFTFARFALALAGIALLGSSSALGQKPSLGDRIQQGIGTATLSVSINVRDASGVPMDGPCAVTLTAIAGSYKQTTTTREASTAEFTGLTPGDYEAEATYPGYQTARDSISLNAFGSVMRVYIYMTPESDKKSQGPPPKGLAVSPKLQAEIDKGLEAMRKKQFEAARTHFGKGLALAPGNPDLSYLVGSAELGLNHNDLAIKNFEHALSLDPTHERSLLALGELQLRNGDTASAIATLEKAFLKNGAGWRTHLLLATAYAKAGRMPDAETHAFRAAQLAREKGAGARLLLGEILAAEGNLPAAKSTWQDLASNFPNDPAVAEAQKRLASLPTSPVATAVASNLTPLATLPVPAIPSTELLPAKERPWAPPDIDSHEFPLAENASCNAEEILNRAEHRLKSQMENFEKFTATEHIEHQEIDRLGRPGPVKSRDFSYIVFVNRYASDSFFLDEDRYSAGDDPSFPTSLATQGLNNLGVAILQPAARKDFTYRCEGLASIRGKASWQIRFEEKKDAARGVRNWRRDGKLYQVPVKGRVWLSSTSFDVLRIETDLREPVQILALTRDHLLVDYGPVNFASSNITLWLPWSAEMHMELHGHRYHHMHYLTDYMLFGVDTNHKIGKPKNAPPATPTTEAIPAGNPNSL